jgi:hypothetical protein
LQSQNFEVAENFANAEDRAIIDGMKRIAIALVVMLTAATNISTHAQQGRGRGPQAPPNIVGAWTGTWSSYTPARASTPPQEQCAKLTATITQKDAVWTAVFEGDCGRPYKYSISMEGKLQGPAVLFKGSADLGAQDGGVYDWIGRAVDNEFVGFYTNAYATGVFSMKRAAAKP